jgi:hypothetical protein
MYVNKNYDKARIGKHFDAFPMHSILKKIFYCHSVSLYNTLGMSKEITGHWN